MAAEIEFKPRPQVIEMVKNRTIEIMAQCGRRHYSKDHGDLEACVKLYRQRAQHPHDNSPIRDDEPLTGKYAEWKDGVRGEEKDLAVALASIAELKAKKPAPTNPSVTADAAKNETK